MGVRSRADGHRARATSDGDHRAGHEGRARRRGRRSANPQRAIGVRRRGRLCRVRAQKVDERGGADRIALQDPSFYETMCLVSKWQGATRTESSRTILNQHIAVVHNVSQSHARNKKNELELPASSRGARPSQAQLLRLIRRTHFRLGQFSDHLYAQSEERLSSPEWAQSEKLRARNEEELASLKQERAEKRARLTRSAGSLSREEASALEEETRMLHRRIFFLWKSRCFWIARRRSRCSASACDGSSRRCRRTAGVSRRGTRADPAAATNALCSA